MNNEHKILDLFRTKKYITTKEVENVGIPRRFLVAKNEIINILSYNYETIIAEKFESIISRNINNPRMKDYYDLYMFTSL